MNGKDIEGNGAPNAIPGAISKKRKADEVLDDNEKADDVKVKKARSSDDIIVIDDGYIEID